ncbi:hypothetical protein V8E52_011566 [Russula decolorans]
MVFGCSKSHSWTRNSFPGGKSYPSSMLFGPVLPVTGSPYTGMGTAAIPAYSPMVVSMQMSAPVPVAMQQPSPVVQVLPQPVIQVTPSPVVAALPPTYTMPQTYQLAPHVPSPVIQSSIPVPQPSLPQAVQSICHDHHLASALSQHQEQQQQGSPSKFNVNLYVNTPEHRSRQLDDRSPSPTSRLQLWEQQQQWQEQQQEQQQQWQQQQEQQHQQWQVRQQQQQQQWQQQQLHQRGRPQSTRPPTAQPPTPSSVNISVFAPEPMHPGSYHLTSPTPAPR